MKGIAFSTVAFVIIGLVAVWIVLSVFQSMLPGFIGKAFCKVYQAILTLPLPSYLKPTIPGCFLTPSMERIELKELDANELTDYIINCWEKSDSGKGGQTFICYEIFARTITSSILEKHVTDIIKQKNYCSILPNNILDVENQNYDCGGENLILWKIGEIKGKDVTIVIKYNAFVHKLEVV